MIDRCKLVSQISSLTSKLFPDLRDQSNLASEQWNKITNDSAFLSKVEAAKSSFLLPGWEGNLTDTFKIEKDLKEYSVLAVDGSQVYPDRHISGAGCFLVNTGGCLIDYQTNSKSLVSFFSNPEVFLPQDVIQNKITFSSDLVDLKREELEFKKLFEKSKDYIGKKFISFVDGSLIFWHLEGKQQEVKDLFLNCYLSYLNKFYENNILIAGYISFPKSRELVNLIRLGLCRFTCADCIACHSQYETFPCKEVDSLIDTQVVKFFLKPCERTTIFYSKSKIVQYYPEPLRPCFFYLNVGQEIARIEVPAWIAKNKEHLDFICKAAVDQSEKGHGYPVVLAESHEQAVVKGADRDFFHHLIQKVGIDKKRRFFVSQKSLKKRGIGV